MRRVNNRPKKRTEKKSQPRNHLWLPGLTFEIGRALLLFAEVQRAAPFEPVRTQLVLVVNVYGPAVIAADVLMESGQDQPRLFYTNTITRPACRIRGSRGTIETRCGGLCGFLQQYATARKLGNAKTWHDHFSLLRLHSLPVTVQEDGARIAVRRVENDFMFPLECHKVHPVSAVFRVERLRNLFPRPL